MNSNNFDNNIKENTWCPGCGNFGIITSMKKAFSSLNLDPKELVLVSGIGQAAKSPQYIKANYFIGLHGRALPVATGIKTCQPEKTVIVQSGDGCSYGEGGNHFISTIRRNPNILQLVHNNFIYGLTKGQASPTTQTGHVDALHPQGVKNFPFNPLRVALDCGAGFVARCFSGNIEHTQKIIEQAIAYPGYALIDILQPCVSFNKKFTHKWFQENTLFIPDDHPVHCLESAWKLSENSLPYHLGIYYQKENPENSFEKQFPYMDYPLYEKSPQAEYAKKLIREMI